MKEFSLVTLFSVAAVAAAPTSSPSDSLVTHKSAQEFADCVAQNEGGRATPWWFVPKEHGGTFSNLGAATDRKAFVVFIRDDAGRREIAMQDAKLNDPTRKAVIQCI